MTDDNQDITQPHLDVIGTTGGKATVETTTRRARPRADLAQWLSSRESNTREDALLGEIIRICVRLDKAGFAKLYAMAKTEEAAMDARLRRELENWPSPDRGKDDDAT